jgi:hypothetical protein
MLKLIQTKQAIFVQKNWSAKKCCHNSEPGSALQQTFSFCFSYSALLKSETRGAKGNAINMLNPIHYNTSTPVDKNIYNN